MPILDMAELLAVQGHGMRTVHDLFTGPALPTASGRSFGGQVLGQALMAAGETVTRERELHSLHGYFLRPGKATDTLTFEVARLFDGGSFTRRRVQAFQYGEPIMSMIVSFQSVEPGIEHQERFDTSRLPDPESLPNLVTKYAHLRGNKHAAWLLDRPFDFRYVEGDMMVERPEPAAREHVWMRAINPLAGDTMLQRAALAYGSDYLLIEPVARAHGFSWAEQNAKVASLDHSMWFHRPFDVNDWLLYVLESPTAQGGRGLAHGKFYTRDGVHVASVSQESMVRFPMPEKGADAAASPDSTASNRG